MKRYAGLLAAFCLATTGACAPTLPEPRRTSVEVGDDDYPGVLIAPEAIADDFVWQQEIDGRFGDARRSGTVVVQKHGTVLTAVGLTPFGSRAFSVEQRGQGVTFTQYVELPVRLSPRVLLVDLNRAFLMGAGAAPRPDGVHTETRGEEIVRERWRDGRLFERTFERPGGPEGLIRVRYEGGMRGITPPRRVTLENGWFGYALTITTLSTEAL